MPSFGLAVPVLPGKEAVARELTARLREQRTEYEQSRQRAGVSFERVYLQRNPDGMGLVVAYWESNRGFGEVMHALMTSDLPLDQYFIDKNQEITGFDFRAGPAGPEPELVGEYLAPDAGQRGKGLAFAAPLQPGKTDTARQFAREAYVTRRAEMAESRSAKGISREAVFLNQTPNGDVVVVYLEGADPVEGNRQFAASSSAFDRWFKDRSKEIFPPFVNFDQPVPANEEIFSSR